MLDDSSECEKDMHNIKKRLSILMHCDGDMLTEYKNIFDENGPSPAKAEIMKKIGNPSKRLHEMFHYIQHVTNSLRNTLNGETEYVQAHTYLLTSPNFEKVFNQKLLNFDS